MEIENIMQQVDNEFGRAIQSPEDFDFREREPYKIAIPNPEYNRMETAVVDLENQNVQVRYEEHGSMESLTCVKHDQVNDAAIVESKINHEYRGGKSIQEGTTLPKERVSGEEQIGDGRQACSRNHCRWPVLLKIFIVKR